MSHAYACWVRPDSMQPRRLPLISCVWRLAKTARAGSRWRSQFRLSDFLASIGKLIGKPETPVVAIILQGFAAIVIACSGTYGEILNFEVTVDFIFFGLTAAALFVLRRHRIGSDSVSYLVPGHPFTTALFVLSCAGIVVSAVIASPRNSAIALGVMLAGLPVYYFWRKFRC